MLKKTFAASILKKLLFIAVFGLGILAGSHTTLGATTAVQDVLAYTWDNGSKVYILPETVANGKNKSLVVTVKTVGSNGEVQKVDYVFEPYQSIDDCTVYMDGHFSSRLSQSDEGTKSIFITASEYLN